MTLDECLDEIRTRAAMIDDVHSAPNDIYAGLAAKIKEMNEEYKRQLRIARLQAVADRATIEFSLRYEWLERRQKELARVGGEHKIIPLDLDRFEKDPGWTVAELLDAASQITDTKTSKRAE